MAVARAEAFVAVWPDELDAAANAADEAAGCAYARALSGAIAAANEATTDRPLIAPPRSLGAFVRGAWDVVEPDTPFLENWHIDAICAHLEAVTRSYALVWLADPVRAPLVDDWWRGPHIRELIINIPPGFMKSLIVAVFWPAWVWTFLPSWRGIFSSYAIDLAMRDSVRCRDVLVSDWYQTTFRPTWRFSGDQNVKSYFQNTATGFRLCVSVGSKATGFRGHAVAVDDPLNAEDSDSEEKRPKANRWWDRSMSSRVNDKRSGARVVVMQRLHEQDLTGHLLERGGYQHLCLPLEYEPKRQARTSLPWADPRTEPGACLFPTMFPPEVIAQTQRDMGDDYPGQYQQRPSAQSGTIFRREWFRTYDAMPPRFHDVLLACDANVKETKAGSYAVVQLWGRVLADQYLIGQVRARLGFPELLSALRWMAAYVVSPGQTAGAKLIEDKANGPAAIATLKREIPGILAVPVEASKEARWRAASPYVQAGNVYLPGKAVAAAWTRVLQEVAARPESWLAPADVRPEWVREFVEEMVTVPKAATDDQADTATMAILRFAQPTVAEPPRARPKVASAAAGAIAAMG